VDADQFEDIELNEDGDGKPNLPCGQDRSWSFVPRGGGSSAVFSRGDVGQFPPRPPICKKGVEWEQIPSCFVDVQMVVQRTGADYRQAHEYLLKYGNNVEMAVFAMPCIEEVPFTRLINPSEDLRQITFDEVDRIATRINITHLEAFTRIAEFLGFHSPIITTGRGAPLQTPKVRGAPLQPIGGRIPHSPPFQKEGSVVPPQRISFIDVQMVVQQTGVSYQQAHKYLIDHHSDVALVVFELSKNTDQPLPSVKLANPTEDLRRITFIEVDGIVTRDGLSYPEAFKKVAHMGGFISPIIEPVKIGPRQFDETDDIAFYFNDDETDTELLNPESEWNDEQ
jgi:NACalpha-BTF3-like transcription factor